MTDKLKKKYGWTHVLMSYTKTSGCWRKKKRRKSNHLHHLPRLRRRRRHCRCQHVHHRPHHKDILSSSSCLQFLSIISSQLPPGVRPGKSCSNLSRMSKSTNSLFSLSLNFFPAVYIYSYVLYIHSCTQTFSSTLSLFPFDFLFALLSFFIFILYHSIAM